MINITLADIKNAEKRIAPYIHKTPVLTSAILNNIFKSELYFKCENFQKTGAFKIRGSTNAVFLLNNSEAEKGVITHSSGNHAAGIAKAAGLRGIKAYIVMPENASNVKISAVKQYGGHITFCASSPKDREETARRIIENTGATLIHSYNDARIIAGQGTAGLEFMNQIKNLDAVLTPLGGGGLTSGVALCVKSINANVKVYACEPENVNDAFQSIQKGKIIRIDKPKSLADGLLMPLRELTFAIIKDNVDKILLASEEKIVEAMQLVYERMKIIIEPSSAVPIAAMMQSADLFHNRKVGIIISGGNVDLNPFFNIIKKRIV